MSLLKKASKHIIIYSLGNILIKLIGIILLPIYTTKISVEDFGVYGILETSIIIISTFFSLNISTAMLKWISDEKEITQKKQITFNSALVTIFAALFIIVGMNLFSRQISLFFFNSTDFSLHFRVMSFVIGFEIWTKIPLNLIRYLEKPVYYTSSIVFKLLTTISLIILFVVYKQYGIIGIFIGQIGGGLLFFLITLPVVIKHCSIKLNTKLIHQLLRYSVPLIMSSIGVMLLTQGDKYILKLLLGFYEVGLYNFASKIARVINMIVVQSFNLALLPIFFKVYKTSEGKKFLEDAAKFIVVIIGFVCIFTSSYGKGFLTLFIKNKEYLASFDIILILITAYIFNALKYVFMLPLYAKNETKKVGFIFLMVSLFNILMNFVMIPIFGYRGAAYSTFLSTLILCFIFYFIGKKIYNANYPIFFISVISVLSVFFTFLGNLTIVHPSIRYSLPIIFLIIIMIKELRQVKNFFGILQK